LGLFICYDSCEKNAENLIGCGSRKHLPLLIVFFAFAQEAICYLPLPGSEVQMAETGLMKIRL